MNLDILYFQVFKTNTQMPRLEWSKVLRLWETKIFPREVIPF